MECEKVRDRFSSLREGELSPSEEKMIREHLYSCAACQKDYARFDQTIGWLHSVGEVEMPEGFLPGIYKKMEDQKDRDATPEKAKSKGFLSSFSFKIPAQAMAMVTILFLVLYLTKMMPVETPPPKDAETTKAPLLEERKTGPPLEALRLQEIEKAPPPASLEKKKKEPVIPKMKEEAKEEMREEEAPSSKTKRMSPEGAEPPKPLLAAKPLQEIALKISDRRKVLLQLDELVKQFGGEIVKVEGNALLASLPIGSIPEFEKELGGLSSSGKEDKMVSQKDTLKRFSVSAGVKKREVSEKGQEPSRSDVDRVNYITIRILLLLE